MDKKKKIRPKTLAKLYNCDVEKYLKSKKIIDVNQYIAPIYKKNRIYD